MQIVDVPVGSWQVIVNEASGTVTLEIKGAVMGQAEDIQIPFSLALLLAPIEAQMTNPFAKWALGLLLQILG